MDIESKINELIKSLETNGCTGCPEFVTVLNIKAMIQESRKGWVKVEDVREAWNRAANFDEISSVCQDFDEWLKSKEDANA